MFGPVAALSAYWPTATELERATAPRSKSLERSSHSSTYCFPPKLCPWRHVKFAQRLSRLLGPVRGGGRGRRSMIPSYAFLSKLRLSLVPTKNLIRGSNSLIRRQNCLITSKNSLFCGVGN